MIFSCEDFMLQKMKKSLTTVVTLANQRLSFTIHNEKWIHEESQSKITYPLLFVSTIPLHNQNSKDNA